MIAANRESFTVALGTITQSCTIGYDVIDEAGVAGTFTPGNPTYSGALTGNTAVASTGINNVTFTAPQPIGVSKSFTPNQIQAGGTSTAQINLVVPRAGTLAVTEADRRFVHRQLADQPGVLADAERRLHRLPADRTTGAGLHHQRQLDFVHQHLAHHRRHDADDVHGQLRCHLDVVGAPLNQIPAGAVTSTAGAGASNTQTAKASLTVAAGLGVQKTFVAPSFPIGSTDYIRLLITNTATPSNLSGGSLVDNMPAFLVLASTTEGPIQTGDPPLCGGTISGTVGSSSYTLNGLAVGGYIGGVAGQCVVYVLVKASPTAVPGRGHEHHRLGRPQHRRLRQPESGERHGHADRCAGRRDGQIVRADDDRAERHVGTHRHDLQYIRERCGADRSGTDRHLAVRCDDRIDTECVDDVRRNRIGHGGRIRLSR